MSSAARSSKSARSGPTPSSPAINSPSSPRSTIPMIPTPGYSFPYIGGAATYVIIRTLSWSSAACCPTPVRRSISIPLRADELHRRHLSRDVPHPRVSTSMTWALKKAASWLCSRRRPDGTRFIDYALHSTVSLLRSSPTSTRLGSTARWYLHRRGSQRQGVKLIYVNTATSKTRRHI